MARFRPCIDLMDGRVVQIVGGSLRADGGRTARVNFQSERPPEFYAELYRADTLPGGHVIALGPGNREAALAALRAFPGGFHYGGGVNPENARDFLDAGASHVIVTSYVFSGGRVDADRLRALLAAVGRERLVLDLSCRRRGGEFWVVTDRWQLFTDVKVTAATLGELAASCAEFLVHGVDVEGKMSGIQAELVELLGAHSPVPATYAGGVRELADLARVSDLGRGRVDVTVGSALDIFGGPLPYRDVVAWHQANRPPEAPTR
jgi:phosphoribosylformimino-5-aminoimidazole carboxamide ribotide isomerase